MPELLFPFGAYWWLYLAFTWAVLLLLALDLTLHSKHQAPSYRQSAIWSAIWIVAALVFGFGIYWLSAARLPAGISRQVGMEFLAGYLMEKSLSVDNMFVFALLFRHFGVPADDQRRVLFYGVLGAIVLRGLMIAAGAALIHLQWTLMLFGAFLIYSGVRLGFEQERRFDPSQSRLIHGLARFLPVTREFRGSSFFVRVNGTVLATPLFLVLLFLEGTDVAFALDSVPAVFGVTREPFIVYSSNICAILGLRSLFFLLAGVLDRFRFLKYGLAAVLVFVGLKMIWLDHLAGGRFAISWSLAIIAALILGAVFLSILKPLAAPLLPCTIPPWLAPLSLSITLLALGAAALCFAVAGTMDVSIPGGLDRAGLLSLLTSGVCYLVLGVALLYSLRRS